MKNTTKLVVSALVLIFTGNRGSENVTVAAA